MRIVVACVGNLLRGDDGFGPAVAERLADAPAGVEVHETGIGGMAIIHELMGGCDALVVVDAVDRGAEPGTVFVIEPAIGEYTHVPDVHLANPERVLALAKGLGCLPPHVLLVGCQPVDAERLGQGLSPPIEAAVDVAAAEVRRAVSELGVTWEGRSADRAGAARPRGAR